MYIEKHRKRPVQHCKQPHVFQRLRRIWTRICSLLAVQFVSVAASNAQHSAGTRQRVHLAGGSRFGCGIFCRFLTRRSWPLSRVVQDLAPGGTCARNRQRIEVWQKKARDVQKRRNSAFGLFCPSNVGHRRCALRTFDGVGSGFRFQVTRFQGFRFLAGSPECT